MTAPPTPNMGPMPSEGRRRGGSVSGGPWQLIEVSSSKAAAVLSQPASPNLQVLRTPSIVGGAPPADIDLEEWDIGEAALPADYPDDFSAAPPEDTWEPAPPPRASTEADGFDPMCLVGDWTDSLGHRITVSPTETGRRQGRRQGKRGAGRFVFLAVLQKFGVPDKRFNISRDSKKKEWVCGNGVLVRDETTQESIVWLASDGRKSNWTRLPPEGPVYFDAPPAAMMSPEEQNSEMMHWGQAPHGGPPVFFVVPDSGGPPLGEWKALRLPVDDEDPMAMAEVPNSAMPPVEPLAGDTAATSAPGNKWNLAAAEFVPRATPAAAPAASDTSEAEPVPNTAPEVSQEEPAAADPTTLQLSEESPDLHVMGSRLEWHLPDDWGKLSRFPKDFCITSPMFGVRQAANMQLVFYPNGSRTAEPGHCTVALTRGPDSAGIKFKFSVNGRDSGPKVCLGRRYLGDYPKPFDDSEDSKSQKVAVSMQVLDVLGV